MTKTTWALVLFFSVFGLVYGSSLWYASALNDVPSFVFSFEKHIPFIPWTIIPYLSSGVFFCTVFLHLDSKDKLYIFLKRVLFMTLVAGIGFVFLPLKYSFAKPEIDNSVFNYLFRFLDMVDDPYNQSPSLHVAFAFAFWTVFRNINSKLRTVAAVWLLLLGISTLTTYQHHVIDILTGSILAHVAFIIFPSQPRKEEFRNMHVANYYFLGGWITILSSLLLMEFYNVYWLNLLWLALPMFFAGYQYQRNNIYYLKTELANLSFFKGIF